MMLLELTVNLPRGFCQYSMAKKQLNINNQQQLIKKLHHICVTGPLMRFFCMLNLLEIGLLFDEED